MDANSLRSWILALSPIVNTFPGFLQWLWCHPALSLAVAVNLVVVDAAVVISVSLCCLVCQNGEDAPCFPGCSLWPILGQFWGIPALNLSLERRCSWISGRRESGIPVLGSVSRPLQSRKYCLWIWKYHKSHFITAWSGSWIYTDEICLSTVNMEGF